MHITLHDHIAEKETVFAGTPDEVEIRLRREFPWLNEIVHHGDLEGCLDLLDSQQGLSIEMDEQGANELHKTEAPIDRYLNRRAVMVKVKDLDDIPAEEWNPARTRDAEQRFGRGETPPPIWISVARGGTRSIDDGLHRLAVARRQKVAELPAVIRAECPGCGSQRFCDANFNPDRCQTDGCDEEHAAPKLKDYDLNVEPGEPVLQKDDPEEENLVKAMHGFRHAADSAFETARWMAQSEVSLEESAKRYALRKHDGDVEYAALDAYGFNITDGNLAALRGLDASVNFAKAQPASPMPAEVVPAHPDGTDAAEEVRRGFDAGTFRIVNLNGKHSKGSMMGMDPKTKHRYLLKPGSGKPSPASGVTEEDASQSRREAAFWHVADALHLGEYLPRADLLYIDGKEVAAIQMLPLSFKNLGDAAKNFKAVIPQALMPYLVSGIMHKWAILDFILGNPDRHSQNIMLDTRDMKTLRLIDHGSAMAGEAFDPAHDENSFVPFYLRGFTSMKFSQMDPKDKLNKMPLGGIEAAKVVDRWFSDIDEKRISSILSGYGIDPEPAEARIAELKLFPGHKDRVVNALWAGVGVERP